MTPTSSPAPYMTPTPDPHLLISLSLVRGERRYGGSKCGPLGNSTWFGWNISFRTDTYIPSHEIQKGSVEINRQNNARVTAKKKSSQRSLAKTRPAATASRRAEEPSLQRARQSYQSIRLPPRGCLRRRLGAVVTRPARQSSTSGSIFGLEEKERSKGGGRRKGG